MPRNNRDWTPEDEKKLLEMRAAGTSFAVIAQTLRRTQSAVEGRAYSLKNRMDPSLQNTEPDEEAGGNSGTTLKRWTPDEDARLRSLINSGRPLSYVAAKLTRTIAAVAGRARKLGLKVKK